MGLLLTVRIVVLQPDKDREQLDRLPRVLPVSARKIVKNLARI